MTFKCGKCGKKVKTQHLLDKHLNRQDPCDIIIKCDNCNKIFNNRAQKNSHNRRKTPCIKNVNGESSKSDAQIQLEIEREKTLRLEKEKKSELDKLDKEMQMQAEKTKNTLLILAAKKEKDTSIELLKTERKEKTASVINNTNNIVNNNIIININIANTNNTVQHLTNQYIPDTHITFKNLSGMIDMLCYCVAAEFAAARIIGNTRDTRNKEEIERIYHDNKGITGISKDVIKFCLNNNRYPEYIVVYYSKSIDKFLSIYTSDDINNI